MPTYRNVTSKQQSLDGKVINPNQTIHSLIYYNEDQVQLLKTKDEPWYNPILLSQKIEKDTILKIPETGVKEPVIKKYAIHFYVADGEVDIRFNSKDNLPALLLYPQAKWNLRCFDRTVDTIIIKGLTPDYKVWVIIEKL